MKKFIFLLTAMLAVVACFASGFNDIATAGLSTAMFFPAAVNSQQYRNFFRALNLATKDFGIMASPGDLRSEVALSNTQSVYKFTIRQTEMATVTTFPQQKGVQDNDIFIGIGHGIFWDNRVSGSGKIELQSYPNPTAAAAFGATAADFYALYSGSFNVQVGSTEFIKQMDSVRFLTTPEAQQSSSSDKSEFEIHSMLKVIGAYPVYSGKADNKVTLTINTSPSLDIVGDSGQTVLTYFSVGLILNNGANNAAVKPSRQSGKNLSLYDTVLECLELLG